MAFEVPVVRAYGPDAAIDREEQVWDCYRQVFDDFVDFQRWREDLFERQVGRSGYRLVTAERPARVVGFSWGYVGQRGQYWTDRVWNALPSDVRDEWVGDHYEIVSLGVIPAHRHRGLGRQLHDELLSDVQRRCLLSTADDLADPAVRLYLSSGWAKLGNLQPGVHIMGLNTVDPN